MARPIKYDKEEVIDKTMNLFWSKGYESVSVDDIMVATDFNRNSFYKLFKNKDGAYDKALEHYITSGRGELQKLVEGKKGLEVIKTIFDHTVEKFEKSNGCLILNTLNTNADIDKKAVKRAKAQAEDFENFIYAKLVEAKERGEVSSKQPLKILASTIITTLFGVRFRLKIGDDREKNRRLLYALLEEIKK